MEKVITKKIETEVYLHEFYCDECSKHLGTVKEYDDGYVPEIGKFEVKFYVVDGWHHLKKYLCDECKQKYIEKIKQTLLELGFEED